MDVEIEIQELVNLHDKSSNYGETMVRATMTSLNYSIGTDD